MQNAQTINWLAILAPSLIVGLSAIIAQILLAYWLSRRTADYQKEISEKLEDYKKDISKELENYKFQLQSDFQTRFYTFQTKFSLWHQRQEEATVETFEKLAELEIMLLHLANWDVLLNLPDSDATSEIMFEAYYEKSYAHLSDLTIFYDKKRIYLDKEMKQYSLNVINWGRRILKSDIQSDIMNPKIKAIIDSEIVPSMRRIEKRFEMLFSAEMANN